MKNGSPATAVACLLATVDRSGRVESRHHGAIAVVRGGRLAMAWGDPAQRVYARSAVKPLQALPVLERGIDEQLGWGDHELALLCASHDGTPEHVAVVRRLLADGAFTEDDLQCGAHAPLDPAAALALARAGGVPTRLHNNCSGKHAGFLHLARSLGVPAAAYLDPESDSQRLVRETVAAMAGVGLGEVEVGVDGCAAPTLMLPLGALARAFWALANPTESPPVRARACLGLTQAVGRAPFYLAGHGRLAAALIASAPGRVFAKNGAEGVFCVGVRGEEEAGIGVAIKVADGNERGYTPVVVELLQRLGVWPRVPPELADFHAVPVRNTQKIVTGHVRSALSWDDACTR